MTSTENFRPSASEYRAKTLRLKDRAIVDLLAEGYTFQEIADKLFAAKKTVQHRVEYLRETFGAKNITNLIVKLVKAGEINL